MYNLPHQRMCRQTIQPTHSSVYLVVYQIQEVKTMVYEQVPDQMQALVVTENIKYDLLYSEQTGIYISRPNVRNMTKSEHLYITYRYLFHKYWFKLYILIINKIMKL